MFYVLDDEEYSRLVHVARWHEARQRATMLREILLAETDFVCIHDPGADESGHFHCDECPASGYVTDSSIKLCELERRFSK